MKGARTPIVTTEREAGQPWGPGDYLLGAIASSFIGWFTSGIYAPVAGLFWTVSGALLIISVIAFGVRAGGRRSRSSDADTSG